MTHSWHCEDSRARERISIPPLPTAAVYDLLIPIQYTPMGSLVHLIYASVATTPFSPEELARLLRHARAANEKAAVTGMLLYAEGSFFQVLEGEPAAVDFLVGKIAADPRHTGIVIIIREPIARRSFEEWSMGFSSLSAGEIAHIDGLNDFFAEGSCLARLETGRARKLLAAFAQGRWRAKITGPQSVAV